MRPGRRTATALAGALILCLALPAASAAQTELVALDRVHDFYVNGQPRNAARALSAVSVEFRNEIGRCRDESIGAKLIELEPRIDALVSRLNAGTVSSAAVLTREFAVFDDLLAQNHLQLAELGWSLRRFGNLDGVGRDLDLAARYVERRARWTGRSLDADAVTAVTRAKAAAAELLQSPDKPTAGAEQAIAGLAAVVKGMN